jgi:hypothetical protein
MKLLVSSSNDGSASSFCSWKEWYAVSTMDLSGHPVLIVMPIAIASALLVQIRIGSFRLPIVVLQMTFGII